MNASNEVRELEKEIYQQQIRVSRLRREVFQQSDPSQSATLFAELRKAEESLSASEQKLAAVRERDPSSGAIVEVKKRGAAVLGAKSTGLEAQVYLRMAQVPTSIYHLFDPKEHPLVSCRVKNATQDNRIRRVRVTSFIEGYSAQAINTFELVPNVEETFDQLPTLFPERVVNLTELTRASLTLLVEDLDNGKVEIHTTLPIWLLPRTTAPLAIRDPHSGRWLDLTPYLGAFVTPNAPPVMEFLRLAADFHSEGRLVGYQIDATHVEPQVKALYEALKAKTGIRYVNSVIEFSPEEGAANQRVRLPRESLQHRQANCIDGTVLFASLLEAISMSPAIVIIPGHAFLAWETWGDQPGKWRYLETTMIGSHDFEQACASAEYTANEYMALAQKTQDPSRFRLWPLRTLRAEYGITPME